MSLVKSWMSRTIALALAIAVVLTGTIQATPAWAIPVTVDTPVITGNTGVGSTLSVTEGTWSPTADSTTYQWLRGGTAITGATNAI